MPGKHFQLTCDCRNKCHLVDGECEVLHQARLGATAEGRAQLREEYRQQLVARAAERDAALAGRLDADVPHRLQRMGVPYDAVRGAKERRPSEAVEAAQEFIRDRDARFLLLLGEKGVGKTSAAALALWDFVAKYPWNDLPQGSATEPAMFCPAFSVTRLSAFEPKDRDYVARLGRAHLLVVDDVGNEGTEFGRTTLVDLLLAREASRKRTVLTGNMTPKAFAERYGEALVDRVRASGIVRALKGRSLRATRESRP